MHVEVVSDNVRHSLCVSGGSGSTAVDAIVHLCQLVRHTVGNVGACGGTRVSAHNDTTIEGDGKNRGSHAVLSILGVLTDEQGRIHVRRVSVLLSHGWKYGVY